MSEFVDFIKLREERDFFNWYNYKATELEKQLRDLVDYYSEKYFSDFRFEPDTIVADYIKLKTSDDGGKSFRNVFVDPPEELEYFNELILEAYLYKVNELDEGTLGQVNYAEHSITVIPKLVQNEDEGKPHILHEIIHIYEELINMLSKFYHDILMISLYKDLNEKIPDLHERIVGHTHILAGDQITKIGGDHDILFFLKSLDLDLRCGYPLGTVCGYGRDEY